MSVTSAFWFLATRPGSPRSSSPVQVVVIRAWTNAWTRPPWSSPRRRELRRAPGASRETTGSADQHDRQSSWPGGL